MVFGGGGILKYRKKTELNRARIAPPASDPSEPENTQPCLALGALLFAASDRGLFIWRTYVTKHTKDHPIDRAAASRVIDVKEVCRLTSLHRATLYDMTKRGEFPRPVKLAKRRVAWREADVLTWLEKRPAVNWAA